MRSRRSPPHSPPPWQAPSPKTPRLQLSSSPQPQQVSSWPSMQASSMCGQNGPESTSYMAIDYANLAFSMTLVTTPHGKPHITRDVNWIEPHESKPDILDIMQREVQQHRPSRLHLRMHSLLEALKGWPSPEHTLWPSASIHALVSSLCFRVSFQVLSAVCSL